MHGLVDTAIVNGKVMTLDSSNHTASAVAISNGRILFVGTNEEISDICGPDSKVIDAGGRVVLPGFIDTHTHFANAGLVMTRINCMSPPTTSIEEILVKIADEVKRRETGEWILAEGYNMGRIWEKEGRHINRIDIDKVAPNNPVRIESVGGHTGCIYNSYALNLAGIDKETPDPQPPAVIERDEQGNLTGLVSEKAEEPLINLIPEPTLDERKEAIKLAGEQFLKWGITTVHDAMVHPKDLAAYQAVLGDSGLPVRTGLILKDQVNPEKTQSLVSEDFDVIGALNNISLKHGFGSDFLWIVGIKLVADGAFTGRTAAMSEPYLGDKVDPAHPTYKGILHFTPEYLHKRIYEAHSAGLRPCIHAQGDYGIEITLDGIEKALKAFPMKDHRIRLEHGGLTPPHILKRISDLGVCVSSTISFLGGDVSANWFYWGKERMDWTYTLRSFLEYGIVAAGNADWSVTDGNPMLGISTAVNRIAITGEPVGLSQAISVEDALHCYTKNAAYLEFKENEKGTIEPGKLADIVILDKDPTLVPKEDIKDIKVDLTILDGKVVFER